MWGRPSMPKVRWIRQRAAGGSVALQVATARSHAQVQLAVGPCAQGA